MLLSIKIKVHFYDSKNILLSVRFLKYDLNSFKVAIETILLTTISAIITCTSTCRSIHMPSSVDWAASSKLLLFTVTSNFGR